MLHRLLRSIQPALLLLNALQLGYLAHGYLAGGLSNRFPVLDALFEPALAQRCTASGCWQSIVPFLGATYLSLGLLSFAAVFFRHGVERIVVVLGLAAMHGIMAAVRVTVVPDALYAPGAAHQASLLQAVMAVLLACSCLLPAAMRGARDGAS